MNSKSNPVGFAFIYLFVFLLFRIYKDQAADATGQLFVGDAIIKVNGEYITACVHDDAVNLLRNAGDIVFLTVKHYRAATPFLQKQRTSGLTHLLCMAAERVSTWMTGMKRRHCEGDSGDGGGGKQMRVVAHPHLHPICGRPCPSICPTMRERWILTWWLSVSEE